MLQQQILPVLYDLAVTIGGEMGLKSLLTRTLQRLLYHTSYSAGFVCLDLPQRDNSQTLSTVRIAAAVGDFELIGKIGQPLQLPSGLLHNCAEPNADQTAALKCLGTHRNHYQSFCRLPLPSQGVIVLLAVEKPDTPFVLAQVLQPVLAQLDKAIVLCRTHDDLQARAKYEIKRAQEQIHQLAHYDALTGLPNRTLLQDGLHKAMAVSARTQRYGAVLFLDLNDFKSFNDSQGLTVGDSLLKEVSVRLTHCVREGGMVARSGGDLFIVVLEGLSLLPTEAAAQAESVAERIQGALARSFDLGSSQASITASIGIVMFLAHNCTAESLLKHADTAMNQAKTAGRNTIRFFDPRMQAELEARLSLLRDLNQALTHGELQLYFQKQVNAQGQTTGAEVLLRWLHPQRGMVSPTEFIPVAEDTGVIVQVGLWVLQAACQQLKTWQAHPRLRDLTLAVNVSARQFHQADFVDQVRRLLVQTGAKPSHLKLELTESVVLEHMDDTIAKMRELKLMGLSFSLDDFGTGYSSLQYLKRLPIDQLKIDQGFVRDITTDPNDAVIVQTIIAMTDAMGLNVIAEGVETGEQQAFLEQRGCHAFQGYYFGRPVPLAQFEEEFSKNPSPFQGPHLA